MERVEHRALAVGQMGRAATGVAVPERQPAAPHHPPVELQPGLKLEHRVHQQPVGRLVIPGRLVPETGGDEQARRPDSAPCRRSASRERTPSRSRRVPGRMPGFPGTKTRSGASLRVSGCPSWAVGDSVLTEPRLMGSCESARSRGSRHRHPARGSTPQNQLSEICSLIRVAGAIAFHGPDSSSSSVCSDGTSDAIAFYVPCRKPAIRVEETGLWHLACRGQGLV